MTVNCARLIKPDQHATNGIVHVVDRVITAVSNNVNVFIEVDDDLETLRVSTFLIPSVSQNDSKLSDTDFLYLYFRWRWRQQD